jgi:TatD DNase family protein
VALNQILRTRLSESAYIDIHCHKAASNGKLAIVSMDTADFNPDDLNNGFYTLGIHPWFIARQDWRTVLDKIAAVAHHPNLLAIGECGLDKAIDVPMPLQIEVFESQIQLAEHLGKPVIIHCVRAFNELMRIRKTAGTAQPWIIHGFSGNSMLTGQLIKQGCYLSLGKALLQDGGKVRQTLAMMPVERLFLETDAAEDVSIGAIYAAAAKILGLDVSVLKQQILSNFQRVFLHD